MNNSLELMQKLGIFCLHDDVEIPSLATRKSACFDLKAYLKSHTKVLAYNQFNHKKEVLIKNNCLLMLPSWRYLIPTGIIFDIPVGCYIKVHPRSGNALKKGLITANNAGIIDEDYIEECNCIICYDRICIVPFYSHAYSIALIAGIMLGLVILDHITIH